MTDAEGGRHVVNAQPAAGNSPSSARGKYGARKNRKAATETNDIFGDFFGFGPNPPGCMSKG